MWPYVSTRWCRFMNHSFYCCLHFAFVNQTNGMHKSMDAKMMCAICAMCSCQILKMSYIMKLTWFCVKSKILLYSSPWGYSNMFYHHLLKNILNLFFKVLQFKQTSFTKLNLVSVKRLMNYTLHNFRLHLLKWWVGISKSYVLLTGFVF